MFRVLVTRRLPRETLAALDAAGLETELRADDAPMSRGELLERVRGFDGLLAMLSDRIDEELLEAAGDSLRVVANYAVGYDNIDVEACTHHGVLVTNTPGVNTVATADQTMALLLTAARRTCEGDRMVRRGEWTGWAPTQLLGLDLQDATLGIIGMGGIGTEVARRAIGFGMRVRYHNRSRRPDVEQELGVEYEPDLHRLISDADVISVHTPLTPATVGLIGRRELELLGPAGILINTSRGPVVDEEALIDALEHDRIFAAGLDVYTREPEVPEALRRLENVVLAPHLGSATHRTRAEMGRLCVEALVAVSRGEIPVNALNPEAVGR